MLKIGKSPLNRLASQVRCIAGVVTYNNCLLMRCTYVHMWGCFRCYPVCCVPALLVLVVILIGCRCCSAVLPTDPEWPDDYSAGNQYDNTQ